MCRDCWIGTIASIYRKLSVLRPKLNELVNDPLILNIRHLVN
jgi:hypothetical protein